MSTTSTFDGAQWRKSSRSQGANACVEVAVTAEAVGVRDSKNPQAGHFTTTRHAWDQFTAAAKAGSFDR